MKLHFSLKLLVKYFNKVLYILYKFLIVPIISDTGTPCPGKEEEYWSCDPQHLIKVGNIYEDSLDLIPSPTPSVKIQIIGEKVSLN